MWSGRNAAACVRILPTWALLQPCETYANPPVCTSSPQQRGASSVSRHEVSAVGTCASARGAGSSPSDSGAGPTAWVWRIPLTAQTTAPVPSSPACPARRPSDLLMQQPCCKSWINLRVRYFSGMFLPCCGSDAGASRMHHSLSHSTASLLELLVHTCLDHYDMS